MNRFLITPVRNEALLLERFLEHHAPLFEKIVIADQGSTDGSWEIANAHPQVIAIRNHARFYDEHQRRELMLEEVRRREPNAFVMGLDADEFLLADPNKWFKACSEWALKLTGHHIEFHWNIVDKGLEDWSVIKAAFCSPRLEGNLKETFIHGTRVPLLKKSHFCNEFPVLHLNLLWPKRQQMKVWWYAAMEAAHRGRFSLSPFRLYHMTGNGLYPNKQPIPDQFQKTVRTLVEKISLEDSFETWQREQVLDFFKSHPAALRHAAIWGYNWHSVLSALGLPAHPGPSPQARFASYWVRATHGIRTTVPIRLADSILERTLPCLG
jgi:hypothetical protein